MTLDHEDHDPVSPAPDPADLIVERQLAHHAAAGQTTTEAAATVNNERTHDAPTKKKLVSPPGAKQDLSGRSYGIVGPPDWHNPKVHR